MRYILNVYNSSCIRSQVRPTRMSHKNILPNATKAKATELNGKNPALKKQSKITRLWTAPLFMKLSKRKNLTMTWLAASLLLALYSLSQASPSHSKQHSSPSFQPTLPFPHALRAQSMPQQTRSPTFGAPR
jgi:hypothetical protein